MKQIVASLKVCRYQIKMWKESPKIYLVFICMFIFLTTYLLPVRVFLEQVGEAASPFILPFLFSNGILSAILFLGIVILFCNAPFYNNNHVFIVLRVGKQSWIVGQMMYIFAASIWYMVLMFLLSILILVPYTNMDGDWGRIWTTLALTDARVQFMIPFQIFYELIIRYKPIESIFLILVIGSLVCYFLGIMLWLINISLGRRVSIVLVMASLLLTSRVTNLPSWVKFLAPISWLDLSKLSEYAPYGMSGFKVIILLIAVNIVLSVSVFIKMKHTDIAD